MHLEHSIWSKYIVIVNLYQRFSFLLLALVWLGIPGLSFSQSPVIVSDDFVSYDLGYGLQIWDSTTLANATAGMGGPGQLWDFDLVISGTDFESVSYNEPSNTPGRSFFPAATTAHEWYRKGSTEYYQQDQDKVSYLGEFTDDRVSIAYSDPKDLLLFPMAYGDAFTDSFAVTWMEDGQQFSRNGTIEREVDGYGELRIRGGSYDQTLRVKTLETWTEQGPNGSVAMRREYHSWFRANAPFPLAELGYETNGSDTTRFGSSLGAIVVCLCPGPVENGFNLYPNPARDISRIQYYLIDEEAPVSLRVVDMSGRLVLEKDWGTVTAGEYDEVLEVDRLPNGMYLVQMQLGEQLINKKLQIDK